MRTGRKRVAWSLFGACLVVACGGSSSETPPPLKPDFRAARTTTDGGTTLGAGSKRTKPSEPEDRDTSAPSTWGAAGARSTSPASRGLQ